MKSSVDCEEKSREDCQMIEWEECHEKPKVICKKTLVGDPGIQHKTHWDNCPMFRSTGPHRSLFTRRNVWLPRTQVMSVMSCHVILCHVMSCLHLISISLFQFSSFSSFPPPPDFPDYQPLRLSTSFLEQVRSHWPETTDPGQWSSNLFFCSLGWA